MKKIIVFYSWAGVGHYREAKAIADQLTADGNDVILNNPVDTLKESKKPLAFLYAAVYYFGVFAFKAIMTRYTHVQAEADTSEESLVLKIEKKLLEIQKSFGVFVGRRYAHKLFQPDSQFIVTTHPLTTAIALGIKTVEKEVKIMNVCPDEAGGILTFFYQYANIVTCVNTQSVKNRFVALGTKDQDILVTGHPLDPAVLTKRQEIYDRVQTTLKRKEISIGLYIGGFTPWTQTQSILEIIKKLSPLIKNKTITVHMLTGPHKTFSKQVSTLLRFLGLHFLVKIHHAHTLLELVALGHKLMLEDINIMFSRPSELIFYSLATGIPHILLPSLGGQEEDMYELLKKTAPVKKYKEIKNNVAEYVLDTANLIKISDGLFNSRYPLNGAANITDYIHTHF